MAKYICADELCATLQVPERDICESYKIAIYKTGAYFYFLRKNKQNLPAHPGYPDQKFIEGATLWIIGIHRSPDDHG